MFFKSITLFFGGKERISAFPIRQARVGEISTKHKAQIAISSTMTVSNHHRLCDRTILSVKVQKTPPTSSVINHSHIDFHLSLTTRVFPQYNLHCCSIHRVYL